MHEFFKNNLDAHDLLYQCCVKGYDYMISNQKASNMRNMITKMIYDANGYNQMVGDFTSYVIIISLA